MDNMPRAWRIWAVLGDMLAEVAVAGAQAVKDGPKPRRGQGYRTRRPGEDTPLWNVCAGLLREELKPFGAKARLARYLGLPRQRLNDFLKQGSRAPDAETLLQMLTWLAAKRDGRDPSV